MKKGKSKRVKLFVERRLQGRFLFYTVSIAILISGVFYGANWLFFATFINKGQQLGLPPDHIFFRFISEQQHWMNSLFIATTTISTLLLILLGLYLSNRVAGPVFKLKAHLNALTQGEEKGPIRFREKDLLKDLADAVNAFVESRK